MLVDDHRCVLWGLAKLIESARPQLELVDIATCHSEAFAAMQKHRPHVVLLDLDLGGESGFDLVPQLASQAAVLILTGLRDPAAQERAVVAGARGVIYKTESAELILKAIGR
ncbi:MAG TPA: response regulator transcription factor, partial [Terrimicrobiaceae bacterium]|nr:response regulator transcription factor [Terrimicrobiaceae bacterium]